MAFTYEELKHKTVAQLREIARGIEHEAVKGYSQLNKEHLIAAICNALEVDMHVHHQVVGINKSEIKAQLKSLKQKRDEALAAQDHQQLKAVRREMHHLKVRLHHARI